MSASATLTKEKKIVTKRGKDKTAYVVCIEQVKERNRNITTFGL